MVLSRFPIAAGILFFSVILVSSFVRTIPRFDAAWSAFAAFAVGIGILIALVYISLRLRRTVFLTAALAVGFALRLAWILWNPSPPNSDFLFMYNAAVQAASGDYSFATTPYFTKFPYQLGFTLYESLIIRLFGNSLLALKWMNVLFGLGTSALLYLCASRTFREPVGRIAMLLYLLYVPNILMDSVLTNQHLSIFFFLLGLWLLSTRPKEWTRYPLAGLAFAAGHLMRPLGEVYLVATVAFIAARMAWHWRETRSFASVRQTGYRLGSLVLAFFLIQFAASEVLIASDITPNSLSGGDKYWKFVVGLNSQTNGQWSAEDARYTNAYPFGKERSQAELALIRQRLSDPGELLSLFGRKLVAMWGNEDSSVYWSMQGVTAPYLEKRLNQTERIEYLILCLYGVVSLLYLWMKRPGEYSLCLWVMLVYIAAHLLVENQTRYRLDLIPVLMIIQSNGIDYLSGRRLRRLFIRVPLPYPIKTKDTSG